MSDNDSEENYETPKKKSNVAHRAQKFKQSWIDDYKAWLRPVENNVYKAKCILCNCQFGSELSIIKRHLISGTHKSNFKVVLVEQESKPLGMELVNANRMNKKTHVELMELEESLSQSNQFTRANAQNKLDIIGRQMRTLQDLMQDVIEETKLNNELNRVACNFVKKPGHVYHLYQKHSGQKYFGMVSPEEWVNAPHDYLGSYRLEVDYSWTEFNKQESKYEGLKFLQDVMTNPRMKALMNINI